MHDITDAPRIAVVVLRRVAMLRSVSPPFVSFCSAERREMPGIFCRKFVDASDADATWLAYIAAIRRAFTYDVHIIKLTLYRVGSCNLCHYKDPRFEEKLIRVGKNFVNVIYWNNCKDPRLTISSHSRRMPPKGAHFPRLCFMKLTAAYMRTPSFHFCSALQCLWLPWVSEKSGHVKK